MKIGQNGKMEKWRKNKKVGKLQIGQKLKKKRQKSDKIESWTKMKNWIELKIN